MLLETLRLIAGGEIADLTDLADRLEVSPGLAVQMLEDLRQRGYLRLDQPGCTGGCEGCPLAATCSFQARPRLWTVTSKGSALLEDPSGASGP